MYRSAVAFWGGFALFHARRQGCGKKDWRPCARTCRLSWELRIGWSRQPRSTDCRVGAGASIMIGNL